MDLAGALLNVNETDLSEASENGDSSDTVTTSIPYYLETFRFIIASTREDSNISTILSEDPFSISTLTTFDALSPFAQRLYVRLFLRKYTWLKRGRIKYDDEFGGSTSVDRLLEDLCTEGFLENRASDLDLSATLNMLSLAQMRELAKQFRVGLGGTSKSDLISLILQKIKEQRTPFGVPLLDIVRKNALKLLGKVYRLTERVRQVFLRLLSIFQLTAGFSSPAGHNPIFALLQVNIGMVKFPVFTVSSTHSVFASWNEFVVFETARRLFDQAMTNFEEKKFEQVRASYLKILPSWESVVEDESQTARVLELPPFLRRFTVGYQYTKVIEKGIESLERLDEKSDAINGYIQLLDQTAYVPHHRGDWYNRLTILLLRVDKRPDAAAQQLFRGIRDPLVRPQHRLELCDRLKRILKQLRETTKKAVVCPETSWTVRQPVNVEIKGRLCPTERMGKGKTVFVREKGDALVSNVEELALTHFLENGFTEGVHDEGSLFTSIYGLLCWDLIYEEPVPNVFRSKFQTVPLDLTCPTFFTSRQAAIEAKIALTAGQTMSEIAAHCTARWQAQQGVQSPLINWYLLPSIERLNDLVNCFTPTQLSRLIRRYSSDFGSVRSGFPDLTIWNGKERRLKVVEVKGPNDRLSHKQSIWIDFLMDIEIDVEVCHVVTSGSKRKSLVLEEG